MSQTVSQDEKDSLVDISAAEKGLESSRGTHTRKSSTTTSYGEMRQLLYRRSWVRNDPVYSVYDALADSTTRNSGFIAGGGNTLEGPCHIALWDRSLYPFPCRCQVGFPSYIRRYQDDPLALDHVDWVHRHPDAGSCCSMGALWLVLKSLRERHQVGC